MAYTLTKGVIPDGLVVRHRCDNAACCNPAHLELGTALDNVRDRVERGRGRGPRGNESGNVKLTAEKVRAVRTAEGSQREIAARYGICQQSVSDIRCRKTWAWLEE